MTLTTVFISSGFARCAHNQKMLGTDFHQQPSIIFKALPMPAILLSILPLPGYIPVLFPSVPCNTGWISDSAQAEPVPSDPADFGSPLGGLPRNKKRPPFRTQRMAAGGEAEWPTYTPHRRPHPLSMKKAPRCFLTTKCL